MNDDLFVKYVPKKYVEKHEKQVKDGELASQKLGIDVNDVKRTHAFWRWKNTIEGSNAENLTWGEYKKVEIANDLMMARYFVPIKKILADMGYFWGPNGDLY